MVEDHGREPVESHLGSRPVPDPVPDSVPDLVLEPFENSHEGIYEGVHSVTIYSELQVT